MNGCENIVMRCRRHRVCVNGNWEYIDRGDSEGRMGVRIYCPACRTEVHAEIEVYGLFISA
jgi:hypothetical protein